MKEQESKELFSNLGIKTSLNKTPLLGNILLWVYKMNKITEEFLLGDKFMPAMNLKQLGFTYSACGPFTKSKELKNLCKQEILFTKMMPIELVFKMLWLMVNQKI